MLYYILYSVARFGAGRNCMRKRIISVLLILCVLSATGMTAYADGLPLGLSNRGKVIIQGKLCSILGRISMEMSSPRRSKI